MGYRDYYSAQRRTSIWSENNALLMLIIFNVFVFITLRFILAVYGLSYLKSEDFYRYIFQWFSMPADIKTFATRPWTMITAHFTHLDLWLLLTNMFWLWTYGYILQDLTGNRQVIPVYLYGGIAASITYLISYNLFPEMKAVANTHYLFGATTSILAIATAATTFSPGYRLFPMIGGGIPLWVVTLVFGVIDIFYLSSQPGLYIPHLMSALTGFLYIQALKRGNEWGEWMNNFYDWFVNLFNPKKKPEQRRPMKQEVFYNTRGHQPYKKTSNLTQQRIDEILDKINIKGYDRLSEEEKELLRRASEEDL